MTIEEALHQDVRALRAEVERLRAVLADTPENIDAVASEYCRTFGYKLGINFLCRCILNVLRARALKGAP